MSFVDNQIKSSQISIKDVHDEKVASKLNGYDQNSDSLLSFDEIKGETVITPVEEEQFIIQDETSFNIYHALINSTNNAKNIGHTIFTLGERSANSYHAISTENWIINSYNNLIENDPFLTWGEYSIYDIKIDESKNINALYKYDNPKIENDSFYFSVSIDSNLEETRCEVNGSIFNLTEKQSDPGLEYFRKRLLSSLFVSFITPFASLSESKQNEYRDFFETQMLLARPDMFKSSHHNNTSSQPKTMQERILRLDYKLNPNRIPSLETKNSMGDHFGLSWRSEMGLKPDQLKILFRLTESLPPQLVDVLENNNLLKDLSFEIIEDEVMEAMNKSWKAYHNSQANSVWIKKSELKENKFETLAKILTHELGHRLHPENDLLIKSLYERTKNDLYNNGQNNFVTPYAMSKDREFFAEAISAYFNGEKDKNPSTSSSQGPKDRSELRKKQPELYLALRLFFENTSDNENHFCGNKNVFNVAPEFYKEYIADQPKIIDPTTSITEVLKLTGWYKTDL